jgi:lipoate-protein ligase B
VTAPLPWYWLGRVDHATGVGFQAARRDRVAAGDDAAMCLVLCEHEPVITLGRAADEANILADRAALAARGVAVVHTRRGGDVTYHGPGQLMVYPVVRLTGGVVAFLAAVAGALAEVAAELGVPGATWRRDPAGLWLGDAKLAACGLHLRRRVTLHGFAFNVATPDDAWRDIVPCGLSAPIASIAVARAARGLPPPPPLADVAAVAAPRICAALDRAPQRAFAPLA